MHARIVVKVSFHSKYHSSHKISLYRSQNIKSRRVTQLEIYLYGLLFFFLFRRSHSQLEQPSALSQWETRHAAGSQCVSVRNLLVQIILAPSGIAKLTGGRPKNRPTPFAFFACRQFANQPRENSTITKSKHTHLPKMKSKTKDLL